MSTPRAAVIDQLYDAVPSLIAAVTDPAVIADAPLKDRVAALTAVDKFLYHLEKLQAESAPRPATGRQQRAAGSSQSPAAGEPFGFEILYPGDPGYDDPNPWVWVDDDDEESGQPPAPSGQQNMVQGSQPLARDAVHNTPRTWDDGLTDDERRADEEYYRQHPHLAPPDFVIEPDEP